MVMLQEQWKLEEGDVSSSERQHEERIKRLRIEAENSRQALTRSYRLLGRKSDDQPSPGTATIESFEVLCPGSGEHDVQDSPLPDDVQARLLQWEAEDLAAFVPDEMQTPRRQFALHLYEVIRYADSVGMSLDRLLYHVKNARERVRLED